MFKSIETQSVFGLTEKFKIVDTDFTDTICITYSSEDRNRMFKVEPKIKAIIQYYENHKLNVVAALYQYLMYLYNSEWNTVFTIDTILKNEFSNKSYYNELVKYTKKMMLLK